MANGNENGQARRLHFRHGLRYVSALACAAIFLWQVSQYSGLIEFLGEIQFQRSGKYWPVLTIMVLSIGVYALGSLYKGWLDRRKDDPPVSLQAASEGEGRLFRIMVATSLVSFLVALTSVLLAYQFRDPGSVGILDQTGRLPHRAMYVSYKATPDLTHVTVYSRSVGFFEQTLYFAPASNAANQTTYLVQLEKIQAGAGSWSYPKSGYLTPYPTGRILAPLYKEESIILGNKPWALLQSAATVRWPYFAAAGQAIAFGLVSACFAIIFLRRRNRLRKIGREQNI